MTVAGIKPESHLPYFQCIQAPEFFGSGGEEEPQLGLAPLGDDSLGRRSPYVFQPHPAFTALLIIQIDFKIFIEVYTHFKEF